MSWQERVNAKIAQRDARIPVEWRLRDVPSPDALPNVLNYIRSFLSAEELTITESSAVDLVAQLAAGALTAVTVCKAFCHRTALAQQLVNCCTELFFDQALEQARELDERYNAFGPVGPLHGLPISLKDQFDVKDTELSMGYVAWLGRVASKDSVIVGCLRRAGAVFYCHTNVPTSIMAGETVNNIYGYTLNPLNRCLSSGGSSGGEGSLIGARGSILGVGTDIAGSIRLPAWANGLYGIRPSHGRMPYAGVQNSMAGQESVPSVCGPLAHSVADLRLFFKAVLMQQPWFQDPKVVEVEWKEPDIPQALTFGVMRWDKSTWPHPPVHRALDMVINALEKAGYEVIEWEPYKHDYGISLYSQLIGADGGKDILAECAKSGGNSSSCSQRISVACHRARHSVDLENCNVERYEYQLEYMQHWNATASRTSTGRPIDAWISPICVLAGIQPGALNEHSRYY